mmetsp:Transcript_3919/g.8790  ORF Transcript_3919/g.8790 Transcript_3919/m.8790 type:complete len:101 (+) Transcript_3919:241-543(+)
MPVAAALLHSHSFAPYLRLQSKRQCEDSTASICNALIWKHGFIQTNMCLEGDGDVEFANLLLLRGIWYVAGCLTLCCMITETRSLAFVTKSHSNQMEVGV